MADIDAAKRSTREINTAIRQLIANGSKDITVRNPQARHNLAVAILEAAEIRIAGSAGYYCGGLNDGASIEIEGSAGWGLAESMLSGAVRVHGSAGSGAAAALRGGTVVILGDAAARLGVSMKGGLIIVAGNCGYMAGFMAQKGTLVVCGDTNEAFADSMYATVCYVGGKIASLGTDAVLAPMDRGEAERLEKTLNASSGDGATRPSRSDWIQESNLGTQMRVSHRDQTQDLIQKGRDLERIVLSRAVRWHLQHRILFYRNKTVIFD